MSSVRERDAAALGPALVRRASVVVVGVIAAILDLTMVNVALDTLQQQLHASVSTIQWVSTGYALAVASTIPVSGWAFERLGARRAWLLALLVFVVASALCAVAWSAGSLIASQLGPVVGPVLGGFVLGYVGWPTIFLINVPVVALAMVLAWRTVPTTRSEQVPRLDVLGLALLSPGLALTVLGSSQAGPAGGFGHVAVVVPLVAGVALLCGYCVHASRSRVDPPLNVRHLRVRGYATSAALMFGSGITLFGALFLLPLYYQQVRAASALEAGLLLAPQGVGVAVGTILAGRLIDRLGVGARIVALSGLALLAVTTIPFVVAGPGTSEVLLSVALTVRGIGLGMALVPTTSAVYQGLPPAAVPSATPGIRVFQQVGGALGTAVLAVILERSAAPAPGVDGLAHAFSVTFAWVLGLTVLSFVPALLLPGRPHRSP